MADPNDEPKPRQDDPQAKLPYEPPAVISEEVFEIQALACAKTAATCGHVNKS